MTRAEMQAAIRKEATTIERLIDETVAICPNVNWFPNFYEDTESEDGEDNPDVYFFDALRSFCEYGEGSFACDRRDESKERWLYAREIRGTDWGITDTGKAVFRKVEALMDSLERVTLVMLPAWEVCGGTSMFLLKDLLTMAVHICAGPGVRNKEKHEHFQNLANLVEDYAFRTDEQRTIWA